MVFFGSVSAYILLFHIQYPQKRGGVFNCLSEAKKLQFLTKKTDIFGR